MGCGSRPISCVSAGGRRGIMGLPLVEDGFVFCKHESKVYGSASFSHQQRVPIIPPLPASPD